MKKALTLILALMMVLSLAACGGGSDTPEEEDTAPVAEDSTTNSDYDQLLTCAQALYGVEDALAQYAAQTESIKDGTISEEEALAAYADINTQAAEVYTAVEAAQWQGDEYAEEIELLRQAADAISLYTAASYEAMVANDKAALDEATPLLTTYQTQMDALLTALEG